MSLQFFYAVFRMSFVLHLLSFSHFCSLFHIRTHAHTWIAVMYVWPSPSLSSDDEVWLFHSESLLGLLVRCNHKAPRREEKQPNNSAKINITFSAKDREVLWGLQKLVSIERVNLYHHKAPLHCNSPAITINTKAACCNGCNIYSCCIRGKNNEEISEHHLYSSGREQTVWLLTNKSPRW